MLIIDRIKELDNELATLKAKLDPVERFILRMQALLNGHKTDMLIYGGIVFVAGAVLF